MTADVHAFPLMAGDEFDDTPAAPYPDWLWNGYFRTGTDAPPMEPASSATDTTLAVLAYLAVWLMASLSAGACIATLSALFQ